MRAVVFDGQTIEPAEVAEPEPGPGEILIEVAACGVCRTDLHIVDGELSKPQLPLILGHQIVGRVAIPAHWFEAGARVGVPCLGGPDGRGRHGASGRASLCGMAQSTGYDR